MSQDGPHTLQIGGVYNNAGFGAYGFPSGGGIGDVNFTLPHEQGAIA